MKALADKITVVQQIIMRKRNAFRKAGCARCVLYINRVIKLQALLNRFQLRIADVFCMA